MAAGPGPLIEYAAAERSLPGEAVGGDRYLVRQGDGWVIAAVVDGLGHGEEAGRAAQAAVQEMRSAGRRDVTALVRLCHDALRGTRGAVMTVASLDAFRRTMTWLSVGDVRGVLARPSPIGGPARKLFVVHQAGVVGDHLPPLHPRVEQIRGGDTIILASDGIREELYGAIRGAERPQRLADQILNDFGVETDDALVLVLRWLGSADGTRAG